MLSKIEDNIHGLWDTCQNFLDEEKNEEGNK